MTIRQGKGRPPRAQRYRRRSHINGLPLRPRSVAQAGWRFPLHSRGPTARTESATVFTGSVAIDTEPPSLAINACCWAVILLADVLPCATGAQHSVELTVLSWAPVAQTIGKITVIDNLHYLWSLVIIGWRELARFSAAHAYR